MNNTPTTCLTHPRIPSRLVAVLARDGGVAPSSAVGHVVISIGKVARKHHHVSILFLNTVPQRVSGVMALTQVT